jgi:hypothetical protein
MKYLLLLLGGILLGFVAGILFGYRSYQLDNERIPPRPDNVPEAAVWAGGADGGEWVLCSEKSAGRFNCEIYANTTGVLVEAGNFILSAQEMIPAFYTPGRIKYRSVWLDREEGLVQ